MSYSINLSGHGVPREAVRRVFERAVRDLRSETHPDRVEPGWAAPFGPTGSVSAGGPDGTYSATAESVESEDRA